MRADAFDFVEGIIDEAKRRDEVPEACFADLTGVGDQGMCGEGCRGTWEAPSSPQQWSAVEPPSERM